MSYIPVRRKRSSINKRCTKKREATVPARAFASTCFPNILIPSSIKREVTVPESVKRAAKSKFDLKTSFTIAWSSSKFAIPYSVNCPVSRKISSNALRSTAAKLGLIFVPWNVRKASTSRSPTELLRRSRQAL